jgi:hypothetical protein
MWRYLSWILPHTRRAWGILLKARLQGHLARHVRGHYLRYWYSTTRDSRSSYEVPRGIQVRRTMRTTCLRLSYSHDIRTNCLRLIVSTREGLLARPSIACVRRLTQHFACYQYSRQGGHHPVERRVGPTQRRQDAIPRSICTIWPAVLVDYLVCKQLLGGSIFLRESRVEVFKREDVQVRIVRKIPVADDDRLDTVSNDHANGPQRLQQAAARARIDRSYGCSVERRTVQ